MGMWLLTETVKLRQCSLYVDYATRYTIRYSNSSRKIEIFIFSKAPRPAMGPSSFLLNEYRAYNSAVKQVGRVEHHSLPSSAQIKNEWRYSSTPNIRLLSMDTYNFNILPFCKAGFCDQYLFTPNFDSSLQNLRFTSVLNPPPPKKKKGRETYFDQLLSSCYPNTEVSRHQQSITTRFSAAQSSNLMIYTDSPLRKRVLLCDLRGVRSVSCNYILQLNHVRFNKMFAEVTNNNHLLDRKPIDLL